MGRFFNFVGSILGVLLFVHAATAQDQLEPSIVLLRHGLDQEVQNAQARLEVLVEELETIHEAYFNELTQTYLNVQNETDQGKESLEVLRKELLAQAPELALRRKELRDRKEKLDQNPYASEEDIESWEFAVKTLRHNENRWKLNVEKLMKSSTQLSATETELNNFYDNSQLEDDVLLTTVDKIRQVSFLETETSPAYQTQTKQIAAEATDMEQLLKTTIQSIRRQRVIKLGQFSQEHPDQSLRGRTVYGWDEGLYTVSPDNQVLSLSPQEANHISPTTPPLPTLTVPLRLFFDDAAIHYPDPKEINLAISNLNRFEEKEAKGLRKRIKHAHQVEIDKAEPELTFEELEEALKLKQEMAHQLEEKLKKEAQVEVVEEEENWDTIPAHIEERFSDFKFPDKGSKQKSSTAKAFGPFGSKRSFDPTEFNILFDSRMLRSGKQRLRIYKDTWGEIKNLSPKNYPVTSEDLYLTEHVSTLYDASNLKFHTTKTPAPKVWTPSNNEKVIAITTNPGFRSLFQTAVGTIPTDPSGKTLKVKTGPGHHLSTGNRRNAYILPNDQARTPHYGPEPKAQDFSHLEIPPELEEKIADWRSRRHHEPSKVIAEITETVAQRFPHLASLPKKVRLEAAKKLAWAIEDSRKNPTKTLSYLWNRPMAMECDNSQILHTIIANLVGLPTRYHTGFYVSRGRSNLEVGHAWNATYDASTKTWVRSDATASLEIDLDYILRLFSRIELSQFAEVRITALGSLLHFLNQSPTGIEWFEKAYPEKFKKIISFTEAVLQLGSNDRIFYAHPQSILDQTPPEKHQEDLQVAKQKLQVIVDINVGNKNRIADRALKLLFHLGDSASDSFHEAVFSNVSSDGAKEYQEAVNTKPFLAKHQEKYSIPSFSEKKEVAKIVALATTPLLSEFEFLRVSQLETTLKELPTEKQCAALTASLEGFLNSLELSFQSDSKNSWHMRKHLFTSMISHCFQDFDLDRYSQIMSLLAGHTFKPDKKIFIHFVKQTLQGELAKAYVSSLGNNAMPYGLEKAFLKHSNHVSRYRILFFEPIEDHHWDETLSTVDSASIASKRAEVQSEALQDTPYKLISTLSFHRERAHPDNYETHDRHEIPEDEKDRPLRIPDPILHNWYYNVAQVHNSPFEPIHKRVMYSELAKELAYHMLRKANLTTRVSYLGKNLSEPFEDTLQEIKSHPAYNALYSILEVMGVEDSIAVLEDLKAAPRLYSALFGIFETYFYMQSKLEYQKGKTQGLATLYWVGETSVPYHVFRRLKEDKTFLEPLLQTPYQGFNAAFLKSLRISHQHFLLDITTPEGQKNIETYTNTLVELLKKDNVAYLLARDLSHELLNEQLIKEKSSDLWQLIEQWRQQLEEALRQFSAPTSLDHLSYSVLPGNILTDRLFEKADMAVSFSNEQLHKAWAKAGLPEFPPRNIIRKENEEDEIHYSNSRPYLPYAMALRKVEGLFDEVESGVWKPLVETYLSDGKNIGKYQSGEPVLVDKKGDQEVHRRKLLYLKKQLADLLSQMHEDLESHPKKKEEFLHRRRFFEAEIRLLETRYGTEGELNDHQLSRHEREEIEKGYQVAAALFAISLLPTEDLASIAKARQYLLPLTDLDPAYGKFTSEIAAFLRYMSKRKGFAHLTQAIEEHEDYEGMVFMGDDPARYELLSKRIYAAFPSTRKAEKGYRFTFKEESPLHKENINEEMASDLGLTNHYGSQKEIEAIAELIHLAKDHRMNAILSEVEKKNGFHFSFFDFDYASKRIAASNGSPDGILAGIESLACARESGETQPLSEHKQRGLQAVHNEIYIASGIKLADGKLPQTPKMDFDDLKIKTIELFRHVHPDRQATVALLMKEWIPKSSADTLREALNNRLSEWASAWHPDLLNVIDPKSLEFVPIVEDGKPLSFIMGDQMAVGRTGLGVHKLTRPISMAKVEVTQALWTIVMGSNPSKVKSGRTVYDVYDKVTGNKIEIDPNLPVDNVTWYDIVGYYEPKRNNRNLPKITKEEYDSFSASMKSAYYSRYNEGFLDKLNALLPDDKKYRLPTEAEWEAAVRGGSDEAYWFTSWLDPPAVFANKLAQSTWYKANSLEVLQDVGLLKSNAFGLYDMTGNVAEWVSDWAGATYIATERVDYQGPSNGNLKVYRGGSVDAIDEKFFRSGFELKFWPEQSLDFLGFRLVREDK